MKKSSQKFYSSKTTSCSQAINNFLAEKYEVTFAESAEEAQAILATTVPDLILLTSLCPG
jgi:PleD family two-component response regulator